MVAFQKLVSALSVYLVVYSAVYLGSTCLYSGVYSGGCSVSSTVVHWEMKEGGHLYCHALYITAPLRISEYSIVLYAS